jgi:hypothetical protein
MRNLLILGVLLVTAATASAKTAAAPKERYYIIVEKVTPGKDVAQATADLAKTTFLDLLAKRPEFVTELDKDAPALDDLVNLSAYLKKKQIRAFKVELKVDKFTKTLTPLQAPKKGQLLAVDVDVSIMGNDVPEGSWAMTGAGNASIAAEVPKKLSAHVEENVSKEALTGALTKAVDQAVAKLTGRKGPELKK